MGTLPSLATLLRFPRLSPRLALLLPPVLADSARTLASEFEYTPEGWRRDQKERGWADQSIVRVQEARWAGLVQRLEGAGPLGVSHLPGHDTRLDHADHNIMMSFGYVLGLAAAGRDRLSVLDWGGGLGHYLLYARALFPGLELDYHCYDLPEVCETGRRLNPGASFHDGLATMPARAFDLLVSSSSLHYFEDWRGALGSMFERVHGYVYVARLQTALGSPTFAVRQTPRSAGYDTSYPSWFINRDELIACATELGAGLVREFVYDERWYPRRAPEAGASRGFLFSVSQA
jgi:putative methyltransferase (TIGR04325 family)